MQDASSRSRHHAIHLLQSLQLHPGECSTSAHSLHTPCNGISAPGGVPPVSLSHYTHTVTRRTARTASPNSAQPPPSSQRPHNQALHNWHWPVPQRIPAQSTTLLPTTNSCTRRLSDHTLAWQYGHMLEQQHHPSHTACI